MSRESSPFVFGDYWLDKRRDGISPDIWQIARKQGGTIIYRSTKCRTVELEKAKAFLRAHDAAERSKAHGQRPEQADLLPHLFNYLREHGPDVRRLDTIKSSFRAWIGFLMQDELGTGATVADINKVSVARFRRWRMGPHSWEVEWGGKTYRHTSSGVTGEAVQRNIEDLRAALGHAADAGRVSAPKLPSVEKGLRSSPKDRVLSPAELGKVLGYAKLYAELKRNEGPPDPGPYRELALMIATAARPGAAMAFDPLEQWEGDIIDLHPKGAPKTAKRNAVVPSIDPLAPILEQWKAEPHKRVKSRKQWWETAKRALELDGIEAYTIRHTVTTFLDEEGVPGAQMSAITGHLPSGRGVSKTTSKHYLHYDPRNAPKAKRALSKFFVAVIREADRWASDHLLTNPSRKGPISVVSKRQKR